MQSALPLAKRAQDNELAGQILEGLAAIYRQQDQPAEALSFAQQALAIWQQLGDKEKVDKAQANIVKATELLRKAELAAKTENGILEPIAGKTVSGVLEVLGIAKHPNFSKWQIDLLLNNDSNNATFVAIKRKPQTNAGVLTRIDTTKYPDGEHTLRLRVVRVGANYDEYFVKIVIKNK